MAQKIVVLPEIGEVTLFKRRGAKNLRLSIQPNGKVRVSLPVWAPYSSAISFAIARTDWIRINLKNARVTPLKHGQRVGKSYRLNFINDPAVKTPQARLGINSITITSSLLHQPEDIQKTARLAAERALRKEARQLLAVRLDELAIRHGLNYSGLKIKKLSSRWGSCSSRQLITLNYFLVQLPWELIDYVIVHELAHTKHLNHSRAFWDFVEKILPDAKSRRKKIKTYRPILFPSSDMQ
jgi:predicted metal-dependent hydrolase